MINILMWLTSSGKYLMHVDGRSKWTISIGPVIGGIHWWWAAHFGMPLDSIGRQSILDKDTT